MAEGVLTKGVALLDLVKLVRTQRASFDGVLDDETWAVVNSRILVGSWYPEACLVRLLVAADRVFGEGNLALCRAFGRASAQQVLQTVYKTAVVPGDVLASLRILAVSWSFIHNTGTVAVETPSDGLVRVIVKDFGLPSPAICVVFAGWIEGKVQVAGGKCQVVEEECRLRGQQACVYAVQWTRE